jgi:hypothetical protein
MLSYGWHQMRFALQWREMVPLAAGVG